MGHDELEKKVADLEETQKLHLVLIGSLMRALFERGIIAGEEFDRLQNQMTAHVDQESAKQRDERDDE